ncbi:fimbrial protein [Providencia manganoxydans]|uniref:fimbrial protein n=1 Tax=Providencia manganoxydans TaxID=2923283 RepID=UPI00280EEE47|nr:fimbrial protein [Providencia stuartii]ELR5083069.1 fimbrial protein [Providencia stuartii]ELR5084610.1 fimbrial protein [Providencia stuartii]
MKKLTVKLTAMVGCLFAYSEYTIAACVQNSSFNNLQSNIPSRVFTIQYDDTTVRNLDTLTVSYSSSTLNTYAPNSGECGPSYLRGNYVNGWTPDANKVAATNIPGIGIVVQTASIGNFNSSFGPAGAGQHSWQVYTTSWTIVIKKTGVVTTTGSLKSGTVARLTQTNPAPYNSTWNLANLNMPANAIQIKVLSCSLKNSVPVINMGDWYDTQFKNIGDTSTDVDIPITLSCLQGTNIKATVTATSGVNNASQGQLALSGTNKATGVAIQIVDKAGKPIPLGTKNTVQNNVPNGDYIFGWKARYIKTANSITPGPANATATVNIRYE